MFLGMTTHENTFSTSINPDFHTWITLVHHSDGIHKKLNKKDIWRFKIAYHIIVTQRRGFEVNDLIHTWQGETEKKKSQSCRQWIRTWRSLITIHTQTKPKQYGLVGIFTDKFTDSSTVNSEISSEFDSMIGTLRTSIPQFHNIRLRTWTDSDKLFQRLKDLGKPILSGNYVHVELPNIEPNRTLHVNVYQNNTLLWYVGCTDVPFPFTFDGLSHLQDFINDGKNYLKLYAQMSFNTPRFIDWYITHYDFGQDGKFENRSFDYTIGQLQLYVHNNKVTKQKELRMETTVIPERETISTLIEIIGQIEEERIKGMEYYEKEALKMIEKEKQMALENCVKNRNERIKNLPVKFQKARNYDGSDKTKFNQESTMNSDI